MVGQVMSGRVGNEWLGGEWVGVGNEWVGGCMTVQALTLMYRHGCMTSESPLPILFLSCFLPQRLILLSIFPPPLSSLSSPPLSPSLPPT